MLVRGEIVARQAEEPRHAAGGHVQGETLDGAHGRGEHPWRCLHELPVRGPRRLHVLLLGEASRGAGGC
eukprot:11203284-Lingulodinium_polyedra.AAC.1